MSSSQLMKQNSTMGIWIMVITMFIFAMQDGLSRHLADEYNVYMVLMVRYWFFAGFVIMWSARARGGLRAVVRSAQPKLQIFRGALLALEVIVMVIGFVKLGLVEGHAMFAIYPLLITALSGPILGEKIGWRRWVSVAVGFVGVLIILKPSGGVFAPAVIYPLAAAVMFAVYGLLNRYVSRKDAASVTFFYTGGSGAVVMTLIGAWFWEPMTPADWGMMALLCASATLGHYLLIRAYELAEASAIQPFAYLQLAFASVLGVLVFGDVIRLNVAVGTTLVVGAGVFALVRAQMVASRAKR
ncbi:DMT family transporter [Pacificibacter marinus]|uniref:DMT family transporter n=1 Tax=Pacificibacter marinus TaxID=658057 RepID=UPI001C06F6E0|nr:DMT family transporter [Pacificibacter marinus]MBU2866153.1 DMT family transporter [Pacificibacter marinus]